ncbi:MAG: hypothetical protein SFY92_11570 [Verrucomicrobiae bacterium]|nr:hypothetical protein [Verrucomicrobiae bacterium]
MKRMLTGGLMCAVMMVMALGVPGLFAENEDLDFTLVNKTGKNISSVYIAPHDSTDWGSDVMESDILRDGESVKIVFHPKATAEVWDLWVEDKEGNSVEWESLDLTKIETLTLKIVKGKPVAEWK